MRKCPICNSVGKEIFTGKILKKYDVKYYQCPECALVYTESPYWLSEAYSDAISRYDTGVMQRNVMDVLLVNMLLELCFKVGGGIFGLWRWLWYIYKNDEGYWIQLAMV